MLFGGTKRFEQLRLITIQETFLWILIKIGLVVIEVVYLFFFFHFILFIYLFFFIINIIFLTLAAILCGEAERYKQFGRRRHPRKQSFAVWLKMAYLLCRRCRLIFFSIFSSGGYFMQRSKSV